MVTAVYVQALPVRIVPARVSVPAGLLMTSAGRFPAAVVAAPVNAWAPDPSMRRVAVPPVAVEAWLRAPWADGVIRPLLVPVVRPSELPVVRVVPAAIAVDARKSSALR